MIQREIITTVEEGKKVVDRMKRLSMGPRSESDKVRAVSWVFAGSVEERLKSHVQGGSSSQLQEMYVFVKSWAEQFDVNNDSDAEGVEGWAKTRRFRGGLRTVAVASVMWCNTGGIIGQSERNAL